MRVITKEEFLYSKDALVREIKGGAVFIYPTDTIYGIGCNAMVDRPVNRVREAKGRYTKPFSIIVPSVQWIRDNCVVTEAVEEWLMQLPGPYTLILKLKSREMISDLVIPGIDTIGVRLPDHWFTEVIEAAGYPVVTTSANLVGQNYMTSLEDLDPAIAAKIDFVIYEGPKEGRPSKLIDLTTAQAKVTER